MSLKLHSVVNGKTVQDELVWLQAEKGMNLKGHALMDRTFAANGKVSNEFRHIFVFPELQIGEGDWVRLCSGTGSYVKVKSTNGPGFIHKLFWGAGSCVWNNNGGDVASLIRFSLVNGVPVPGA